MDIIKLVGCVISVLCGVYVIVKLHTGKLEALISSEKEQREKECDGIKEDIESVKDNIKRLYDTKVDSKFCDERSKK